MVIQTKTLVHRDNEKHKIIVNDCDVQMYIEKGFMEKNPKRGREKPEAKPEVKPAKPEVAKTGK